MHFVIELLTKPFDASLSVLGHDGLPVLVVVILVPSLQLVSVRGQQSV